MIGLTHKQHAARHFGRTLTSYREALVSGDASRIVRASIYARAACRNHRDREAVNRAFKQSATFPQNIPCV